ncbi:MAG: NYN domain-containing protein [Sporichthyaceae bacterium]
MRSYCSLYIDAGYLAAAASTRVTGTSLRSATQMDVAGLLEEIADQVENDSGLPLLRIHWYDSGTRGGGPDPTQRAIATLPRVKLRLGRVGYNGEQKGVDVKLALDLIAQSRNRSAEIVYLISGDDDLSEAVEEAQILGIQVVALVVPDQVGAPLAFSGHLHQTVDRLMVIKASTIDERVRKSPAASMAEVAAATAARPAGPQPTAAAATPVAAPIPNAMPTPASIRPAAPQTPTPLAVPRARPTESAPAPKRSVPAYSTTTGTGGQWHGPNGEEADRSEDIDAVVEAVVQAWWRSATPGARADLMRDRPSIPGEIDRTLLRDLSTRTDIFELPVEDRFALRRAFWERVDQL